MSESENLLPFELLVCSDPIFLPRPIHAGTDRVYSELAKLSALMPERYREVFSFRWGLDTHFPHLTSQTASKFEIPTTTAERMLNQALWNVARYAHDRRDELSATHRLLGEDMALWAERAWQHAQQRWGNQDSTFSETVLLMSIGGMDIPDAHQAARQHMVDLGLGKGNRWGRPHTSTEHTERARRAVDRILEQTIWQSKPAPLRDLSSFTLQRPLPRWARAKTGVFWSEKLNRHVQFDSTLELLILRQLDADPRIIDYQEQPMPVPYEVDGEASSWVPDIVALTAEGAIVIEAKPLDRLGDFTNWIKWSALARYCKQHGLGFWIGSPERSIIEHLQLTPDLEKQELVLAEVESGAVRGDDYQALQRLVGHEQLGLIATAELLEWQPSMREIKPTEGSGAEESRRFWALVATTASS